MVDGGTRVSARSRFPSRQQPSRPMSFDVGTSARRSYSRARRPRAPIVVSGLRSDEGGGNGNKEMDGV